MTLPLIMIVFSLVITIPSFFWMSTTLHPFMTEIHSRMPNLSKAELLLDHIDHYVNPLTSRLTTPQIFGSFESDDFSDLTPNDLIDPYSRFAHPVAGYYTGDSVITNLDLGSLAIPFEEWIFSTFAKRGKGHNTIQGDSKLLFARAKIVNDTTRFNGVIIEMDKYRATLNELVDLALNNTVFYQYFTIEEQPAGTDNAPLSTPFYLELVTDNEVLLSKGIKDPEHFTKYASRTLTLSENVEIIVFTPLHVESMISRAISNIKKTSLFAAALFFFGFVLLLRRKKRTDI